jgi:hypothetical protein
LRRAVLFSWTEEPPCPAADDAWWAGEVYDAAVKRREEGDPVPPSGPAP